MLRNSGMEKSQQTDSVQLLAPDMVEVQSMSDPEITYNVDRANGTCDCPAYRNGATRPCKHLKHALGTNTPGDDLTHQVAEGIKNAPIMPWVLDEQPCCMTIGHHNHKLADFLVMLKEIGTKRLVDVRSNPESKAYPQFNRDSLQVACEKVGIHYHWFGRVLGQHSDVPVDSKEFSEGMHQIERMIDDRERPTLMGRYLNPTHCPRANKVGAYLAGMEWFDIINIIHYIPGKGRISQEKLEADNDCDIHQNDDGWLNNEIAAFYRKQEIS